MLASLGPGPIREPQKVHLINLVEDGDHGPLNNLVLQGRDAQRPLPAISFWYVYPSRWLRSISAAVHPAVQILNAIQQPGVILLPCHAVHTRCRFLFQQEEAIAKQFER